MIRAFEPWDIDRVMEIWLDANIETHSFVSGDYWRENFDPVKEMIPKADVYVFEKDEEIVGFIGLMENYIAGIFVDGEYRSKGIGKELLKKAKESRDVLTLQVYQKNQGALSFYQREGFMIAETQEDGETGEIDLTMKWCRT
ncbi:MAG: GNAT family N-acetyltransferase [Emergencia sp.]|nr:GNAT family N-acetyltransferase [Emergencia sp.]